MDSFLGFAKLALDRGWAFGGLLAAFFGAVLFAQYYGAKLPEIVTQWSLTGVIFGVAVLIVSLASHVGRYLSILVREVQLVLHVRRTLRELTNDEKAFLRRYVINGENTQYISISDGVANGLQAKGIIYRASNVSVGGVSGVLFPWNMQPYPRRVQTRNVKLLE